MKKLLPILSGPLLGVLLTLLAQIRPYIPAHGRVPVDILGDSLRCTIVMSRDNSAPMIITEAPPKEAAAARAPRR